MSEIEPQYSAIERAMSYDERIERAFRQLKTAHREGFIRVLIEAVKSSDANEVRRLTHQLERALDESAEGAWMARALGADEAREELAAQLATATAERDVARRKLARRDETFAAMNERYASLRAALVESCDIGMRINEQAGAKGDDDDVRLVTLRKLATAEVDGT